MTSTMRRLLVEHTADLQPDTLWHEPQLRRLVEAARDDSVAEQQLETAALHFLQDWNRHVVKRRSARFGLVLHATANLPENVDRIADWDARVKHSGGLDGWYRDYTSKAVAA